MADYSLLHSGVAMIVLVLLAVSYVTRMNEAVYNMAGEAVSKSASSAGMLRTTTAQL